MAGLGGGAEAKQFAAGANDLGAIQEGENDDSSADGNDMASDDSESCDDDSSIDGDNENEDQLYALIQ